MADTDVDPEFRASVPYENAQTAREDQRNAFWWSLAPRAKARFLDALTRARETGAPEEEAWKRAVEAAELAYPPDEDLPDRV